MNFRDKVRNIYRFIEDNLYFNRPDMEIKGERYISSLLFSLLTCLNQGKELIIGEPGLGKTTSAEYVSSLVYQYPLAVIWSSEVHGHPEQTEEKIIGRPDLGDLNKGTENVVWSGFAQLPVKIVDEINRLPETKQSMILDGVDRGKWEYLNDIILNKEYCLFATANYQDKGTNTIIAPLIDRFDVMVESKHPGPSLSFLIGEVKKEDLLRCVHHEKEILDLLKSKIPYEDKLSNIEKICKKYGDYLQKHAGIETVSKEDRRDIRKEINKENFDLDASAFIIMVIAELSFCYKYGQKRSNEDCDEGCHYTGYLCHGIRNCASNRLPTSIKHYAQALSWFVGSEEVDIEHVRAVIPHAIAHRIQWKEEHILQREKDTRCDPLPIYLAKEATDDLLRRYNEQKEEIKTALALGFRILNGEDIKPVEGDHPLYAEIRNDLGLRF
ncbi:MAG TPA: hypothetical protein EYP21_00635 [Syntrophaceae bacterium]|nr:hypothetical protein [Syntrophaceae bacterium]